MARSVSFKMTWDGEPIVVYKAWGSPMFVHQELTGKNITSKLSTKQRRTIEEEIRIAWAKEPK